MVHTSLPMILDRLFSIPMPVSPLSNANIYFMRYFVMLSELMQVKCLKQWHEDSKLLLFILLLLSHIWFSHLSFTPTSNLSLSFSVIYTHTHTHTHKSRFEGQYHLMASLNHIFWPVFFELLERQHSLGKQHWARNGPRYRLPSKESTSKESIFLNVLVTLYTFIL